MTVSKFPCSISLLLVEAKCTDATLELADGHGSPDLGVTQVRVHLGVLHCAVDCFATSLALTCI